MQMRKKFKDPNLINMVQTQPKIIIHPQEQFLAQVIYDGNMNYLIDNELKPEHFPDYKDVVEKLFEYYKDYDRCMPEASFRDAFMANEKAYLILDDAHHSSYEPIPELAVYLKNSMTMERLGAKFSAEYSQAIMDRDYVRAVELADEFKNSLEKIKESEEEDKSKVFDNILSGFKFSGGEEYLNSCVEYEPLIDGLIDKGRVYLEVAPEKTGKSMLAYMIAWCGAYSDKFLGNEDFKIDHKFKSLIINYESNYSSIMKSFFSEPKEVCLLEEEQENKAWIDNPQIIEALYYKCKKEGRELLIIDPLYLALEKTDDNKRIELVPVLEKIKNLSRDYEITTIIVSHVNRQGNGAVNNGGELNIEHLQGSKVYAQILSGIITLYPANTQSDEEDDIDKSIEEINRKPLKMILKKIMYRDKIGFTRYHISLNIADTSYQCSRCLKEDSGVYNKAGEANKKPKPDDRLKQLVKLTIDCLDEGTYTKKSLSESIAELTEDRLDQGITKINSRSITNKYISDIYDELDKRGYICHKGKQKFMFRRPKEVPTGEDVF